jgi:hypothetical protein
VRLFARSPLTSQLVASGHLLRRVIDEVGTREGAVLTFRMIDDASIHSPGSNDAPVARRNNCKSPAL